MLLAQATKLIEAGRCDEIVSPIKYLFIDEYQDFSELFQRFISAILARNNDISVFCVGDTWQAINSFMGADTEYFKNFNTYFSRAEHIDIVTNYRCDKMIITDSNNFMKNAGFEENGAIPFSKEVGGTICGKVSDIFIEQDELNHKENYLFDMNFRKLSSKDFTLARYLKCIYGLILDNKDKNWSTLVLCRKRTFLSKYQLSDLEKLIRHILKSNDRYSDEELRKIRFSTMHKSKGDEADLVIIIGANKNRLPLIHPDNELYTAFGETESDFADDERRLFYVAMTRAKHKLYVLYDSDEPSQYITELLRMD